MLTPCLRSGEDQGKRLMATPIRVIVTFMAFFGTFVLSWIVLLAFLPSSIAWLANLGALGIAIYVGRHTWRRSEQPPSSAAGFAAYGAAIVGSVGFAAGFFGPMVFAPAANQGPMLGIFITGPAGALLGALLGFVYGMRRAGR